MSGPENPPAFPFGQNWTMPDGEPKWKNHDGMTLRDWFAGQAMSFVFDINRRLIEKGHVGSIVEATARDSYEIADAMLAERAKAGSA